MSDITIEICDSSVLKCTPAHYLVDGRLWVDVCGEINIKKKVNASIGENNLDVERAFPDALDMTDKNIFIFGYFPCKEVECIINYAECSYRRTAYLVQIETGDKKYVVQWNLSDWRKKAERTSICDVFNDEDVIVLDDATTAALITNESYTDGTLLDSLSMPLDYYGTFHSTSQPINVVREDLRLKINPKIIFERFFKSCGIEFKSPLYDSHYGSIQSRYLLDKEFWNYDGHGTLSNTEFSASPFTFGAPGAQLFPHDTIISGNGLAVYTGLVNGVNTIIYENTDTLPNEILFCVKGTITANGLITSGTVIGLGAVDNSNNAPSFTFAIGTVLADEAGPFDYCFCKKITIGGGGRFTPFVALPQFVTIEQTITTKNCNRHFNTGDVIQVKQIMDCAKSVKDIIDAERQLFNFIPHQSQDESCVTFDIPFDTVIGKGTDREETVRGYFKKKQEAEELPGTSCGEDTLRCGTLRLLKRQYKFCFASSDDKTVNDMIESGESTSDTRNSCDELEEVEGNFIKSLDNLFGMTAIFNVNNSEKKEYCNECYSPSVMAVVPTGQVNTASDLSQHYSSHHYEDDGGLCVGSRATVNYLGTQFDNGSQLFVTFEGNMLDNFLISYQDVPNNIQLERQYSLTFCDAGENLYTLFYNKFLKLLETGYEYLSKRNMSPVEFKSLDTSKYYCIPYEGGELIARILSTDAKGCSVNIQGVIENDC